MEDEPVKPETSKAGRAIDSADPLVVCAHLYLAIDAIFGLLAHGMRQDHLDKAKSAMISAHGLIWGDEEGRADSADQPHG